MNPETTFTRTRDRARLPRHLLLSVTLAFAPVAGHAQQAPDAGQMLKALEQPMAPPVASSGLDIEQPTTSPIAAGGATMVIGSVEFTGNTRFTDDELRDALGRIASGEVDLAGLYALADRISAHYREAGYPFARAYLPAQQVTDGRVRIDVVEGRYGQVRAISEHPGLALAAESYLSSLEPGSIIRRRPLERAALLLEDLPGVTVTPTVRPGTETGTGDLIVEVERDRGLSGNLRFDNQGNRYSGEYRLAGRLAAVSPFMLGDRLVADGMWSDEDLRVGSVDYSLPLGQSGLRGRLGYAVTRYELGEDFAALGATGQAKISTAGLTWSLLRSQRANVTFGMQYQYKKLRDEYESVGLRDDKSSRTFPMTLQFDLRDGLAGGGLTFGAVSWTHGRLDLGEPLRTLDRSTTRTQGHFDKFNLELARLQRLSEAFSISAAFSTQWARNNLDSSESFGLGGGAGVRSYPSGEAYGDEGWLGRLELRYAPGSLAPYLFYDVGMIRVNANPGPNVEDRRERRSGVGLGLRWLGDTWRFDAALAWRLTGEPESDTRDPHPRSWIGMSYNF